MNFLLIGEKNGRKTGKRFFIAVNDAEKTKRIQKMNVTLLFPNQLFEDTSTLPPNSEVFLIEEHLFFLQYKFHKQKLVFHRASMQAYHRFLINNNFKVTYIESHSKNSDIRTLIDVQPFESITIYDPVDDYLFQRDRKSTRLNSSHSQQSRMPSSA